MLWESLQGRLTTFIMLQPLTLLISNYIGYREEVGHGVTLEYRDFV